MRMARVGNNSVSIKRHSCCFASLKNKSVSCFRCLSGRRWHAYKPVPRLQEAPRKPSEANHARDDSEVNDLLVIAARLVASQVGILL